MRSQLCRAVSAMATVFLAGAGVAAPSDNQPLVVRLGFPPTSKLVTIVVDDLGVNHTTNVVAFRGLESGAFSSAAVLVPAPWFAEVAAYARSHPGATFGVHFTLNSEWSAVRWGPVLGRHQVPSLVDELGFLPRDLETVRRHARASEVEAELRAQLEQALAAGLDVTHVNGHMTALTSLNPLFFEALLRVARDHRLPVRLDRRVVRRSPALAHIPRLAASFGLLAPDEDLVVPARSAAEVPSAWLATLDKVQPGAVTEIAFDPGAVSDEMRATVNDAALRASMSDFVLSPQFERLLRDRHIQRVSYRDLRELQRRAPAPAGTPVPQTATSMQAP